MSKGAGKRIAVAVMIALLIEIILVTVCSALVVNGVLCVDQILLWLMRIAGMAAGTVAFVAKRPRKHKRKKRR